MVIYSYFEQMWICIIQSVYHHCRAECKGRDSIAGSKKKLKDQDHDSMAKAFDLHFRIYGVMAKERCNPKGASTHQEAILLEAHANISSADTVLLLDDHGVEEALAAHQQDAVRLLLQLRQVRAQYGA